MRLDSTALPVNPPDHETDPDANRLELAAVRSRRPVRVLTVIALVVLVLSGCASDRATDQSDARETAETTPGLVVADQATFAANRYASPTLTPTATAPPPPTAQEVGIATSVQGSGQPNGFVVSVATNAGTVYLVADLDGLRAGSVVESIWYRNTMEIEDRDYAGGTIFTVEQDGRRWVNLPQTLDGSLPTGNYAVELEVDGEQVATLGIEITPAGSPPRSV